LPISFLTRRLTWNSIHTGQDKKPWADVTGCLQGIKMVFQLPLKMAVLQSSGKE
jgi:hypothetical protein